MKLSEAWLRQAESDWNAADILARQTIKQPNLRCQVMAKYQQIAEKSIKAMVAAVNELGTANFMTITPKHVPKDEMMALSGLKQIDALCRLAPEYPKEGEPARKNTEYPFHISDTALEEWTAPAIPDTFTEQELQSARELVWILRRHVQRFVSSVRLGPQSR